MKNKKTMVRYEVYNYDGPNTTPFAPPKAYTLNYKNPASVSFYNFGGASQPLVINNIIILSTFLDVQAGTANNDYKYQFINAFNEIDVTTYTIKVLTGATCQVVVKYYVNED